MMVLVPNKVPRTNRAWDPPPVANHLCYVYSDRVNKNPNTHTRCISFVRCKLKKDNAEMRTNHAGTILKSFVVSVPVRMVVKCDAQPAWVITIMHAQLVSICVYVVLSVIRLQLGSMRTAVAQSVSDINDVSDANDVSNSEGGRTTKHSSFSTSGKQR